MNLRIGKIRRYNNKILIASPSFKIGTNLKINLLSSENRRLNDDEEKDKPNVKSNKEQKQEIKLNTGFNKERKQDTKPEIKLNKDVKPNIEFKQVFKKPDLLSSQFNYVEKRSKLNDKITYEEEKVALVLGITFIFTVWWILK